MEMEREIKWTWRLERQVSGVPSVSRATGSAKGPTGSFLVSKFKQHHHKIVGP